MKRWRVMRSVYYEVTGIKWWMDLAMPILWNSGPHRNHHRFVNRHSTWRYHQAAVKARRLRRLYPAESNLYYQQRKERDHRSFRAAYRGNYRAR